jgi:ABC-type nitrate/sulfonate/bicarbonate transport system permease component
MNQQRITKNHGRWLAIGIAIGIAIGVSMDNVALGLVLGLLFGLVLGTIKQKKLGKDGSSTPDKKS